MIDFFNRLYSFTFNRISLIEILKVNSLSRFLIRAVSNRLIPVWLIHSHVRLKDLCIDVKNRKRIIVSLTSFPYRIPNLWMVIEALFRQTVLPDKIILYLSKKQFSNEMNDLPDSLLRYTKNGLDIRFVDGDIRSHKKYYYAMRDYPNDVIITVDDDIFYPSTMIQTLMRYHEKYPKAVICRYARSLQWMEDDKIMSSLYWKHLRETQVRGSDFFLGTGGGTLFPNPSECLYKDTLDINLAFRLCPLEDDLWLNTMIRLQETPIIVVKDYKDILPIQRKGNITLYSQNGGDENLTDVQIQNVIDYYKSIGLKPYKKGC